MPTPKYKSREARRLGRRVRMFRERKGLTLQELGQMTDTDIGNLSRIERGQLEPPLPRLRALAKALGVTPADLLGGPVDGVHTERDAAEQARDLG
jgi:transcriptional regulator with XRE-family HTH domain